MIHYFNKILPYCSNFNKAIQLFILLLIPLCSYTQNEKKLNFYYVDTLPQGLKKYFTVKKKTDEAGLKTYLTELKDLCYKKGYYACSVDSIGEDSLSYNTFFYFGNRFDGINLRTGNLDKFSANEIKFKEGKVSVQELNFLIEDLLKYAEDNGYPFASFQLDSLVINNNGIQAAINFLKKRQVKIDSLIIKGNTKTAKGLIKSIIGIKPGAPYKESLIKKADRILSELPYITVTKKAEVLFVEDFAKLYLHLDKKKSNHFYGVIGVLPNNNTTGKIMINGEVKLNLLNAFGRGEVIDINWKSLEKGSQDLKVHLAYPYILSTPFGLSYKFSLYKKDTSYLTINHNIGLKYQFNSSGYVKIISDLSESNLLNTTALATATVLPDFADVKVRLFGIETAWERYNYKFNPMKGYGLFFYASGGNRKIEKNDDIQDYLYDNMKMKSSQFKFLADIEVYIPLFKKTTLLLRSENAFLISSGMFENELFKLGGLKTLKGFDDESITASNYDVLLAEFRYLFEKNSYVAAFVNAAYYEKRTYHGYVKDIPYGLGAGVAFDTKIGVFMVYYALGSEFSRPLSFKQSKIHFGFSNTF